MRKLGQAHKFLMLFALLLGALVNVLPVVRLLRAQKAYAETITLAKLDTMFSDKVKPLADKQDAFLKRLEELSDDDDSDGDGNDNDKVKVKANIKLADLGNLITDGKLVDQQGQAVTMSDLESYAVMDQRGLAGVATQIDRALPAGLPIGSAIIGGASAVIVSEVIDGFVQDPMTRNLVKGGVAVVGFRTLKGFLGQASANIFVGLIVFSIAREILPIDDWIARIRGFIPTDQLGGNMGNNWNGYQLTDPAGMSNVIPAHHGVVTQFDTMFS